MQSIHLFETSQLYDEIRNTKESTIILQGGTWCFSSRQKIITILGSKKISDIVIGDKCLSHNFNTNTNEYKKVIGVFPQLNTKKCYRIKLKNGSIIEATEDHEFFFEGGWHSLKHIVSLLKKWNGNQSQDLVCMKHQIPDS